MGKKRIGIIDLLIFNKLLKFLKTKRTKIPKLVKGFP